ncbi:MAG TPA: di-heme oxidoredictase family protein [Candidatus Acidoferrales bacterium]
MHRKYRISTLLGPALLLLLLAPATNAQQQRGRDDNSTPPPKNSTAKDPGVRVGSVNSGQPLATLSPSQLQFFQDGLARFLQIDSVSGTISGEPGKGLGPGYNSTSCGSCHAQPSVGGTSPSATIYPFLGQNPQLTVAYDAGGTNQIPSFITADGPVREARFPYAVNSSGQVNIQIADGGVHDLFTIAGRSDASGCVMSQPNYESMARQNNLIFRIPTPTFGAGLIENIADGTILANMAANPAAKSAFGISGHPNYSGNDGSITRFGWKAQNKSLEIFAGEAYNVEIGVTNELFQTKRGNPPAACLYNATPEDQTNFDFSGSAITSDVVAFAMFSRFLAPPTPSATGIPNNPSAQSIANGQLMFSAVGCTMCHTPALQTANSSFTAALSNQPAALYSDLLVHHLGQGLADNISQGSAAGDEFRTAPLWGVGQRIFFLHDGRSNPGNGGLVHAIQQHQSQGSEANRVISLYNRLPEQAQQDLLNFLRSL